MNIINITSELIFRLTKPLLKVLLTKAGYSDDAFNRKFGNFETPDFANKRVIMFHGVSVGEIIAIEDLVKKVHSELPDYKIVVTAGTNTGKELAESKFKDIAEKVLYFPPDFLPFINEFLKKIHPEAVVIAETEIWPNFSYMVSSKNIPLFIINGRISDHSFKYYKHLSAFFGAIFDKTYTKILAQSELDRQKFIKMGANQKICEVMGNLKFDIQKKLPEDVQVDKLIDYINKYDIWSKYETESEGVYIACASIHGNTLKVCEKLKEILEEKGAAKVVLADLSREDWAEAVEDSFRYGKIVFASATYDMGIFTPMRDLLLNLKEKNYQNKKVAIIENGTWAPNAARCMKEIIATMKNVEIVEPVVTIKSTLKEENIEKLNELAENVLK